MTPCPEPSTLHDVMAECAQLYRVSGDLLPYILTRTPEGCLAESALLGGFDKQLYKVSGDHLFRHLVRFNGRSFKSGVRASIPFPIGRSDSGVQACNGSLNSGSGLC